MGSEVMENPFITLEPQGNLSANNAKEFQLDLSRAAQKDCLALVVDLKGVHFLDSAGLMALVSTYHLTQRLGRRLMICSVTPAVKIILEITQLDGVFEIFENPEACQLALSPL